MRHPLDLPPLWLLLALGAQFALHFAFPAARWLAPPWTLAGFALVLAGTALVVWGAGLFRRAGTGIRPFQPATELVASGPYRVTRNPMYVGLVVILAGSAVAFGTVGPLVPVPLFALLLDRRFVRAEEAFLAETFGERYRDYCRAVRRWL